jgi:rod shape determining protein RodA
MAISMSNLSNALDRVERRQRNASHHVDWIVVFLSLGLGAFGLLNIYSAKKQNFEVAGGDSYFYVKRQLLFLGIGLLGAIVVALVDYRKFKAISAVGYIAVSGALGLVLVAGKEVKGAKAWFEIGAFQIQPAEFAKVMLIVVIAALGAMSKGKLPAKVLVAVLALTSVPIGLVLIQPDLGTAMVLAAIVTGMLLVAGAQMRHIVLVTLAACALTVFVLQTDRLQDYQLRRLQTFLDPTVDPSTPKAERQQLQRVIDNVQGSEAAIAGGGAFGDGFGKGELTNSGAVYEQRTDFIFSVVGEQFGFVGTAGLLIAYAILGVRIWRTAAISQDFLGTLICAGALSLLCFQVFENVGMSMGIMPVTGIPLPMLSYGGSSTIAFMILMGLVVNVHMHRYTP